MGKTNHWLRVGECKCESEVIAAKIDCVVPKLLRVEAHSRNAHVDDRRPPSENFGGRAGVYVLQEAKLHEGHPVWKQSNGFHELQTAATWFSKRSASQDFMEIPKLMNTYIGSDSINSKP